MQKVAGAYEAILPVEMNEWKMVEAKAEGRETTAPEMPAPARVTDLMEALKRSLEKGPDRLARAAGRRRSTHKARVA